MNTSPYVKVLNQLSENGLHLHPRSEKDQLRIEEVVFVKALPSDLFRVDFSFQGILSPHLTDDEKAFCRAHAISYLTTDGSLYLVREKSVLSVEPRKAPPRRSREKPLAPAWLKTEGRISPQKPTHLISPNSFDILDVLFRLPKQELRKFESGLQFAKSFDLYQPKLSTLMTAMRVRSLIELREAVSHLPVEWWVSALRYPATRRAFTPFFAQALPYHSTLRLPDEAQRKRFQSLVLASKSREIAPGPTEAAKEYGLLRDKDCTVWGTQAALQALKKELRLTPGTERDAPTWFLATPTHGIQREAVVSHHPEAGTVPTRSNVFRSIWDLSYGESRLAEIQVEMLRRVLK
jgi:hypothetical protein